MRELRWLYTEGPGGRGRSALAMTNSTGCSSVWASTYPYNPYPFPWTNHLFQDSTSLAIGVFEGHMRKMADGFRIIRRAELEVAGLYDAAKHDEELSNLDWQQFTDEEMELCPPIIAMGGDGAMLDIGFQNLSRLMASGKPIRVIVLDTQVYSNTGGQACTSGYTGQVSDMAVWGKALRGKQEERKELSLIAIAHRGAFVHQTSQASATHLISGVLRAMKTRRPSIINIYTPCPVEHGLADDWSQRAARLALESRAFPFLTYDPDGGRSFSDCLTLDGNPEIEAEWPRYKLEYIGDDGQPATMELPMTSADWAATEGRFRKNFKPIKDADDSLTRFDEYLAMSTEERKERKPFIYAIDGERRLSRLAVSAEMVHLAEERQRFGLQLRELAGVQVSATVRDRVAAELEGQLDARLSALTADYEAKIRDLQVEYPAVIARRMAEGLMKAVGEKAFEKLLANDFALPAGDVSSRRSEGKSAPTDGIAQVAGDLSSPKPLVEMTGATALVEMTGTTTVVEEQVDELVMEPYIESAICTSCNECTNLNGRMFGYNENKQAFIKDSRGGSYAELVTAAERCPVSAIHPALPLNPKEKDLDKWIKRAQRFN
jgi:pyruvate-ferredoxin/flavodoxin oxidoreductase